MEISKLRTRNKLVRIMVKGEKGLVDQVKKHLFERKIHTSLVSFNKNFFLHGLERWINRERSMHNLCLLFIIEDSIIYDIIK